MQYVVIAHDGTDEGAPARRQTVRDAHIEGVEAMKDKGTLLTGGAILDDNGTMVGSVAVVDFPSREELDAWLAVDPYVTGGVWRHIDVHPFKVAV